MLAECLRPGRRQALRDRAVGVTCLLMFITRFAPSPTGRLHLGHAFAALTIWRMAEEGGGEVALRIEDLDRSRSRPEYEAGIYEDLTWLGLRWPEPVVRQSERTLRYETALRALREQGLLYRCFRTRKEIQVITEAPHGEPNAPYTGGALSAALEDSALRAGKPYSWRLSMAAVKVRLGEKLDQLTYCEKVAGTLNALNVYPDRYGDVVLARKDAPASYHIASVADDIDLGVTDVIRGEDLAPYAGLHRLLYALLGAPAPTYHHHRMIEGADGERLAKRKNAPTLAHLRGEGLTPGAIRRSLFG